MTKQRRVAPLWLSARWEQTKKETADRVSAAIEKLKGTRRAVTMASIRDEVRLLFGHSLSTNTIKRNEPAYQMYLTHRRTPRTRIRKYTLISALYEAAGASEKAALHSKVGRLRMLPKDDLIARLIRLEDDVKQQSDLVNRLREEIIQKITGTIAVSGAKGSDWPETCSNMTSTTMENFRRSPAKKESPHENRNINARVPL
jgi:hypothetical protein